MLNVTSPKVAVPTALFAVLSPGMLLQMPDKIPGLDSIKNSVFTQKTSNYAIFFHALVFSIVYRLVAKSMGLYLKPADIMVTTALFMALSPGLLLTLPSNGPNVIATGKTSIQAVLVHSVVFAIVFACLRKNFPQFY